MCFSSEGVKTGMGRQILGRIFWWKVFIAACLIRLNEDDGLEA